jgi:hypothetical protein
VDFVARRIYLTNGFSTADPVAVTRAIGPVVARAVEPYQFLQPPTVRANGIIPMQHAADANLHFEVDGGRFSWWKFNAERISGNVHWVGEQLALEGVQAGFYSGSATGSARFDFAPEKGADFAFDFTMTDTDFPALMADLSTSTNRLEGRLAGRLSVTRANSDDWRTIQGSGHVSLHDGLIWEIPIFGIFSPVLDAIVPGLGSSRASQGSATFVINNGVIQSDDLEIRASAMRLQYRGAVDLESRVDARVEAELLRDTWVIGRLVSLVLWPVSKLFEYRVSGTLQQPRSEPVFFIPKLVLLPFHPIRTMKELFPEESGESRTNAPPVFRE